MQNYQRHLLGDYFDVDIAISELNNINYQCAYIKLDNIVVWYSDK